MRKTTMGRVRKGRRAARREGYLVTWDLDSRDHASTMRLHHFVFGQHVTVDGRAYRYPGFVEKEGVRYLGQSVLFVAPSRVTELRAFLVKNGTDHEVIPGALG